LPSFARLFLGVDRVPYRLKQDKQFYCRVPKNPRFLALWMSISSCRFCRSMKFNRKYCFFNTIETKGKFQHLVPQTRSTNQSLTVKRLTSTWDVLTNQSFSQQQKRALSRDRLAIVGNVKCLVRSKCPRLKSAGNARRTTRQRQRWSGNCHSFVTSSTNLHGLY